MALFPQSRHAQLSPEMQDMLDSHPSLAASLEDFEHRTEHQSSPAFGIPSQHSGFAEPDSEPESSGRWSPPAWHKDPSGWFPSVRYGTTSRSHSRESSIPLHSVYGRTRSVYSNDVLGVASRVPLPPSPERQTVSKATSVDPDGDTTLIQNTLQIGDQDIDHDHSRENSVVVADEDEKKNYIRFGMHAEVQHRTDTFEEILGQFKGSMKFVTQSWYHTAGALVVACVAWSFFKSLISTPVINHAPDLLKAAGVVRSFEPLIYYSERGMASVNEIQDTGIAVYDLGESVRHSNMSSAPMLVQEMDNLSDSLKVLAIEMTRFFANVNGDVDSMLIVIDWSKRELAKSNTREISTISAAFTNVYDALCKVGIFEDKHRRTTRAGRLWTEVFGMTPTQRTKAAMRRSFTSFLDVLEEAIRNELQHSTQLFGMFEAVERIYGNLARTTQRENDTQNIDEAQHLARLWTRLMGPDSRELKKFQRNRDLLAHIKGKTALHKQMVKEQQTLLMRMGSDMERLRRMLVSPLVRSESQLLSVEEQIDGLVEAHGFLKNARERARQQGFQLLLNSGKGRSSIATESNREIESGRPGYY